MATIVNNPSDGGSGAAGWIVAAVVLIGVILIALFVWPGFAGTGGGAGAGDTNINVEVPTPSVGGGEGGA